ncbi:MAG: DUF456 family protein [Pseudomonadota bacterium]
MKKVVVAALVSALACGVMPQAQAENASKKEVAGFGTGAVVGGAVAGPPGIVIGAAIGALVGDRSHQKDEQLAALSTDVEVSRDQVATLQDALRQEQLTNTNLTAEIRTLDQSGVVELHQMLDTGIELDLSFTTDDVVVDQRWQERLVTLAGVVAGSPDLAIQIDGYADPRGSVEYNQALSLARAEAVRTILFEAGLDHDRMVTFGHGESMASEASTSTDPDLLALQRRVTVTIYRDESLEGVALLGH